MGNRQTGTLGKLSRRVRRNHERAIKARGKREKEMQQVAFKRGFNLGADIFKARILNATAGYEYEPEDNSDLEGCGYESTENVVVDAGAPAQIVDGEQCSDPMSDGPLSVPVYKDDIDGTLPNPILGCT